MSDDVERIAQEIHKQYPVTVEGVGIDWEQVVRHHPERAAIYREAARNRIDPAKWQPLIMNFQKLYGVSNAELVPSRLAEIDEKIYRMPDVDRARGETSALSA